MQTTCNTVLVSEYLNINLHGKQRYVSSQYNCAVLLCGSKIFQELQKILVRIVKIPQAWL